MTFHFEKYFRFYRLHLSFWWAWLYGTSARNQFAIVIRPPQDVDVLAVLDFQIARSRSEIFGFHPRPLLTKY